MRKIKVSSLSTYDDCPREYYYDSIGLKGGADSFFKFTLDCMDVLRAAVQSNDCSIVDKKLLEVKNEWFVLKQEKEQKTHNLKHLLYRYLSFELTRIKTVIASNVPISVRKEINGQHYIFTDKVDFIFQLANGDYEAVKYKLGAPKLTSAARNYKNKPENSIILTLLYEGLKEKYPGIKVSFYHLKHKDDKSTELAPLFNNKANKNIVTAVLSDSIAATTLKHLETMDLENMFNLSAGVQYFECKKESCDLCEYTVLCITNKKELKELSMDSPSNSRPFQASRKQLEVINHKDGPIRVSAPPGSGKTGTIVARYKNLIDNGISPSTILMLSFSKKAVEELQERVFLATGIKTSEIYTYNSFCFSIVTRFKELLGITGKLRLITRKCRYEMIVDFLNANCEKFVVSASFADPFGVYGIIPKLDRLVQETMDRNYSVEMLMNKHEDLSKELALVCIALADYMREQMTLKGLISYSDQIRLTQQLFLSHPSVPEILSRQYNYIMVDEFQDTDVIQAMVLYSIAEHHKNICIVGDDDQSIYGWRGADVSNILRFNERFPGCTDVILVENYRSTPSIVSICSKIISKNLNRIDKVVKAFNDSLEENVNYIRVQDFNRVSKIVQDILDKGYQQKDIAIISRKNSTLDKVGCVLDSAGFTSINYSNKLRENEDYLKLVNFLSFIHKDEIDNITLYTYLRNFYNLSLNEDLGSLTFVEYLQCYYKVLFLSILEERDALRYLFDTDFEQAIKSIFAATEVESNVSDFVNSLIVEEEVSNLKDLYNILQNIITFQEDIALDDDRKYDAIQLITAHAAKGKEYNVVIIPDINEFSPDNEMDEEERRTLYVALSRAKYELYIINKESKKNSPYACELEAIFEIPIAN